MSSRALRRLQKSQLDHPDAEISEEEPEYRPQSNINAFALLNGISDTDTDSDSDDIADNTHFETKSVSPVTTENESRDTKRKQTKKAPSKNQKKKADRHGAATGVEDDDDLDRFLEEVKLRDQAQASKANSSTPVLEERVDYEKPLNDEDPPLAYTDSNYVYFTTSRLADCMSLLSVGDVKNLDPDTELKSLFGKISLETIEDANTSTSMAVSPEVLAQFKKLARLTRGWGGKDHRSVPGTSRKLLLTRIKDDWLPTAQKTLTMDELAIDEVIEYKEYKEETVDYQTLELKVRNEADLGIKYFRFTKTHSMPERLANSKFYASVVMTPDPESLMQLLQQHPYHVETLLQVAMVLLRQGNDKSTSTALVEKALFVFDRSLHKTCHELLQQGMTELVRFPYECFANRQLYLNIFRVITGLGERSTFSTALNYCKLLLAFAPAEDPLGVRYFIDHYAIAAEEYEYLIKFVESALVQTYTQWFTPGLAFSYVLALLLLERKEEAQKAIESAFDAHRWCALQLLRDLCLAQISPIQESDLDPSERTKIEAETYMVRAKTLWKRDQDIKFLHNALEKLFTGIATKKKGLWILGWLGKGQSSTQTDIPINLVRFVILSGENKVLAKIPERVFSRDDVLEYDVMPPKDDSSRYDVFSGSQAGHKITDSLFDYIDHNIISAIVQNRTGAEFHDFVGLDEEEQRDAE